MTAQRFTGLTVTYELPDDPTPGVDILGPATIAECIRDWYRNVVLKGAPEGTTVDVTQHWQESR